MGFFYSFLLLLSPAGINKVFILSFCTLSAPALHSTPTSPPLSFYTFNQIIQPPPFSTYLLFSSMQLSFICTFTAFPLSFSLSPLLIHFSSLCPCLSSLLPFLSSLSFSSSFLPLSSPNLISSPHPSPLLILHFISPNFTSWLGQECCSGVTNPSWIPSVWVAVLMSSDQPRQPEASTAAISLTRNDSYWCVCVLGGVAHAHVYV